MLGAENCFSISLRAKLALGPPAAHILTLTHRLVPNARQGGPDISRSGSTRFCSIKDKVTFLGYRASEPLEDQDARLISSTLQSLELKSVLFQHASIDFGVDAALLCLRRECRHCVL